VHPGQGGGQQDKLHKDLGFLPMSAGMCGSALGLPVGPRYRRDWGTEGSNPSPSTGESGANLTSSIRLVPTTVISWRLPQPPWIPSLHTPWRPETGTAEACRGRDGSSPSVARSALRHPRQPGLLAPYPSEDMNCWPVSARVGSVKHNDAGLIEPIGITT